MPKKKDDLDSQTRIIKGYEGPFLVYGFPLPSYEELQARCDREENGISPDDYWRKFVGDVISKITVVSQCLVGVRVRRGIEKDNLYQSILSIYTNRSPEIDKEKEEEILKVAREALGLPEATEAKWYYESDHHGPL